MKRICIRVLCTLLCLCLLPLGALAERMYLIPDSNTRQLTASELWEWDYESLGYILNEIFARHGYVFIPGGKYEYYFNCMPWYKPNANPNNHDACYTQLNKTEWYNEQLVKDVRADMRARGTLNTSGKSVWDSFSTGFSTLQGFDYCSLKGGQKFPVYSAPSTASYRGANGKASISTNGAVFAAGWESGWLLVMYETNNSSVRVGYINGSGIKGNVPTNRYLQFDYTTAKTTNRVTVTDDPAMAYAGIVTLAPGATVTYLTTFYNNYAWDYIETYVDGQVVRGFIRSGNLDINATNYDDDEIG